MSMVSYAAGSRYPVAHRRGVYEFYDWYCDLPPPARRSGASKTDVPESADWYNSPSSSPGAPTCRRRARRRHFFTEVRYRAPRPSVTPDTARWPKFADLWLHPKRGTDAALAMAMGHVALKEFYFPDQGRNHFV